jgi:hypothetical protein
MKTFGKVFLVICCALFMFGIMYASGQVHDPVLSTLFGSMAFCMTMGVLNLTAQQEDLD